MTVPRRLQTSLVAALRRLASASRGAIVATCVVLAAVPAAHARNLGRPDDGRGGTARSVPFLCLAENVRALPGGPIVLWEPCAREQAERWAADAERDGAAALRAASCYATIVASGREKSTGLEDARRGRAAADAAVRKLPGSGLAHYLAAYTAGLVAERAPLRGLALVPVIEREALRAAELDPGVDRGGPDRMLGELYLRAPGSPFSVGNPEKAVRHYRRAVAVEPAAPENRLGLAEALLARDKIDEACRELRGLEAGPAAAAGETPARKKALDLLERRCSRRGDK